MLTVLIQTGSYKLHFECRLCVLGIGHQTWFETFFYSVTWFQKVTTPYNYWVYMTLQCTHLHDKWFIVVILFPRIMFATAVGLFVLQFKIQCSGRCWGNCQIISVFAAWVLLNFNEGQTHYSQYDTHTTVFVLILFHTHTDMLQCCHGCLMHITENLLWGKKSGTCTYKF